MYSNDQVQNLYNQWLVNQSNERQKMAQEIRDKEFRANTNMGNPAMSGMQIGAMTGGPEGAAIGAGVGLGLGFLNGVSNRMNGENPFDSPGAFGRLLKAGAQQAIDPRGYMPDMQVATSAGIGTAMGLRNYAEMNPKAPVSSTPETPTSASPYGSSTRGVQQNSAFYKPWLSGGPQRGY